MSSQNTEIGNVPHERLSKEVVVQQPGYVYIYLSNDNEEPQEVFFDDFTVTHSHSAIVQADDYYPFGMTFNGYKRESSMMNRFLYQGKELQSGTASYDFHARMYDPALGRTFQLDPHSESYLSLSGYSWVDNNPLVNTDPTGADIQYGQGAFGGHLYTGEDMVKMLLSLQAQFSELNEGREKERDKERERKEEEARAEVGQNPEWDLNDSGRGNKQISPERQKSDPITKDEPFWYWFSKQLKKLNLNEQAERDFNKLFGTKEKREVIGNITISIIEEGLDRALKNPVWFPFSPPIVNPTYLGPYPHTPEVQ